MRVLLDIIMLQQVYVVAREFPNLTTIFFITLFGFLGDFVVTNYLMETRLNKFPRIIFTTTFISSLSLLMLVLFEIGEIGSGEFRIRLWYFFILVLSLGSTTVVPTFIILKIFYRNGNRREASQWASKIWLGVATLIILFYLNLVIEKGLEIRDDKSRLDEEYGMFQGVHVNVLIEMITHYGIWIMALMSGYGAIWCPYVYFNTIYTERKQLLVVRKNVSAIIVQTVESIVRQKHKIIKLEQLINSLETQLKQLEENSNAGYLTLIFNKLKGTHPEKRKDLQKAKEQLKETTRELNTYQSVHREQFVKYKELIDEERKHEVSQTFLGKFFKLMSFILGGYSITRIILTVWNIIRGRRLNNDPITRILNFLFWLFNHDDSKTFDVASNYISFIFMGYLIISSVRSFSMNMKKLFDMILRRGVMKKLQTDIIVLILSLVYGVYFLTAIILLQVNLPQVYTLNMKKVTGEIQIIKHFTSFDFIFLPCSLISIILIYFFEKYSIKRMNYHIEENKQYNAVHNE